MPNNIHMINEQLEEQAKERAKEAAANFKKDTTMTPEELQRLAEIQRRDETVVKETSPDGTTSTIIPVSEFVSDLESQIKDIKNSAGNVVAKGLNVGDIKRNMETVKIESRQKALDAFRKMAVVSGEPTSDGGTIDDDIIQEINDEAIAAVMKLMNVERLSSNDIPKFFRKMSLKQIAEALPPRFVHTYITPQEITANNFKAKDRVIQTLVFLSTVGPEMDYLNDYIDQQNKLMMISNRIIEAQYNMTEVLKSKEKMSEIASQASKLVKPDTTSIWAKYLQKDPMAVHNLFAQQAVTMNIMKQSYEELLEEYKGDYDCCKELQAQIDECDAKYMTYLSVTKLELMQELMDILSARLKQSNKNGYKNLVREAVAAVDRIRRAKQNVMFPVFASTDTKTPEMVFNAYMEQYPQMLAKYNATIVDVLAKNASTEHPETTNDIKPIHIDGVSDDDTFHYFSLILLILYGRIMKRLQDESVDKYGAIELDCYFRMYCKAGTDVYLMTKLWNLCSEFVAYAIEAWPAPKKPNKPAK